MHRRGLRNRVFKGHCLTGIDKRKLETCRRLMLREEPAFGFDDEGLRGDVVAGLAEVDRVVCVQELVVLDVRVWRRELGDGEVRCELECGNIAGVGGGRLALEEREGRDR